MKKSQKLKYIRVISFLLFLSISLGAFSVINGIRAHNYRLLATVSNEKALNELCENLDSITLTLQKGRYATKGQMLSDMETDLARSTACAKISLSSLTEESEVTDQVYKFLSQVGEFTASLSRKTQKGEMLTADEKEGAKALYTYSRNLSSELSKILESYNEQGVSFEKSRAFIKDAESDTVLFSDSVNDAAQSFGDYPTLIYDGPFADSLLQRRSEMLKDKDEITASEAKELAAECLKKDKSELRQDSDENSNIPLYCFSSGDISVGITKKGGYVCYITNPVFSGEEKISFEEAVKRGKKHLSELGYTSLAETYYTTYDGVCTINFAYINEGVIHYADLVKISVCLDTGEIASLDARGFLTNHRERSLPEKLSSAAEFEKALSEDLTVTNYKTALIPTDTGIEKLCYEYLCHNGDGEEYLIYCDAQTGETVDILVLLYEDGGTLVK